MNKKYDYAVFIGRFQPFHIGHLHVFKEALQSAEKLLVLVGSSDGARTLRNPFTFAEREAMMRASLPADLSTCIDFLPLQDFTYDDEAWVVSVTDIVTQAVNDNTKTIALVGHDKDETTYYLKLFPNWAYIEVGNLDGINATSVRKQYFDAPEQLANSNILLKETIEWLRDFAQTEEFSNLAQEYQVIKQYKAEWANTPYPVIFTTTDALVRWRDEVLLIQRKHYPGKDLFALPGGFLEEDETLLDGCLRELQEETQLAVERETLKQSLVAQQVFDEPKRSSRGRLITFCFYFDISHLEQKPEACACDDAKALSWVHIDALERDKLFDDHFFMIQYLLRNKNNM